MATIEDRIEKVEKVVNQMTNLQEMADQVRIALRNLKITVNAAQDAGLTVTWTRPIYQYLFNVNPETNEAEDAVIISMPL